MKTDAPYREMLARLLDWEEAHVGFDAAVDGIAPEHRGTRPSGLPYSPWHLLEHLRRTQFDILDFCVNPDYQALDWPADYWPEATAPPSDAAWAESIEAVHRDRQALQRLAADTDVDLTARIPHGTGQTYLRELVLAADHTAYHVGELVLLRRVMGIWEPT